MDIESAITHWHEAVNAADLERASSLVGERLVVFGPRGSGIISGAEFGEWILRSGIRLVPGERHAITDDLVIVEQDASWPESTESTRVATVFRFAAERITAVLRLPDLATAQLVATVHRDLLATR